VFLGVIALMYLHILDGVLLGAIEFVTGVLILLVTPLTYLLN
jgi:hypothetical protein